MKCEYIIASVTGQLEQTVFIRRDGSIFRRCCVRLERYCPYSSTLALPGPMSTDDRAHGSYSDGRNCVPIPFTINGSPQRRRGDVPFCISLRRRNAKRASGKIQINSKCCRGSFPESPSQGFGETYSSFASSACRVDLCGEVLTKT